ncbi:MAG: cytochrome c biogenesis protein ResB [Candidatus Hydrogenedentes bacterium]|nr:cytochrome c biogenesis protein ResB [Candidatus Hydrogenedentota bacterium]
MTTITKRAIQVIASYWLCILLLFLLFLLTLFGTLEQAEHGIYFVQQKYFNSFYLIHELPGGIPLPLPGAYLVMGTLTLNLLFGAIFRSPLHWKRFGILIAHGGIFVLAFSGFVTFHYSVSGHMKLYEGESARYFESYYDWSITVTEVGDNSQGRQFTIPGADFEDMEPGESRRFWAEEFPFELELSNYQKNSEPRKIENTRPDSVDGIILESIPLAAEEEMNFRGITATLVNNATQEPPKALLWGASRIPWTVPVGEQNYAIHLRHKRYSVPFTITLDKFIRDMHPGTSMAANFESRVTLAEKGTERNVEIKMNHPLRNAGYTLFQASWGPQNAGPNTPLFSSFAVVRNPADQWPKFACYIIGLGMIVHFTQHLLKYLRAETRRRSHV